MRERNKRATLYGERRHPYYLMAPAYDRRSSGIRVMHQLCHSLNLLGEEAYMSASGMSPRLRTPLLTDSVRDMHRRAGVVPIAIYPEIIGNNPLDCDVVVRYILNRPGLLGETPNFKDSDLFWLHNGELLEVVAQAEGVLHMPACDTSIFHNRDNPDDDRREGACIYFGRYAEGREAYPDLAAKCTEITKEFPATHEALGDLFRRSTHIYCFENTSISMEARLCGCPIVQLPSPYVDLDNLFGASLGLNDGLVRDDDPATLAEARALLPALTDYYRTVERNYWRELEKLVDKTQARAGTTQRDLADRKVTARQAAYALWRSRRTPQEIDGQLHAERMMSSWRFSPRFAIGLVVDGSGGELLANTIDSLARQWYAQWQLAIFAPGISAPPELEGIEQISWVSDPDRSPGFDALRATRDADFYAMLPAGAMLDDHALQAIADEVNASPQWLAFYTDHDVTSAEDGGAEPHFKPDFNPELLYSRNYIGASAFICREALDAFTGGAEVHSPSPLGLLLKIFAQTGLDTIGHIADPLIHLPGIAADDAAEMALLARHFEQIGTRAEITEGWFQHTRRVRFARPADATVSVVVLAHAQPGYLRCCLETLLATAGKSPDEILVVAHEVTDPDLEAYLASIEGQVLGVRCRVIREAGAFAPAAFRNRAAALASSDYLLFIDDDTEYFQEGWLDALVGHAAAGSLKAVGPRLISSTDGPPRIVGSGRILGLNGVAGDLGTGVPGILDSGFDLRLQVDQAVSALSGTCLLVRRSDFESLGGFDAEATPRLLHDTEFCLRAGASGGRLAWLGSVDVAHHQGISVAEATREQPDRAEWEACLERERRSVLERHMPRIANDRNYNRNYSLHASHEIDVQAVADWNPRFRDRPRFLGAPLTTGAGQYRVVAPFKALARAGLAQCTIIHPVGDNRLRSLSATEIARLAPDVAVYQSCIEPGMIRQLAESARLNPQIDHIGTIDDRLGDLPRDNPHYALHARQARTRLRESLSHCRRLIVTTEPLRAYFADLIDDIRVVPNCLEQDVWGSLQAELNMADRPRVGWVGAMQHAGDLKLIEPIMAALHDRVDFVLMGMCPEFLKPYVKEVHPFVSITEYAAKMASLRLDLALAPLEIHPFNECKSNLRLLEYGALGWPVVCTDIDPYRTDAPPVIRLENRPDAWIDAIECQLADRDQLRTSGSHLRDWVHANYMLEANLDPWMSALLGR
ncbi:MAG: glycosyltransferase [Rhodocyclaceae bacterium]|nr:glycosyltransferase [Rhodocyclaceae bacterium]